MVEVDNDRLIALIEASKVAIGGNPIGKNAKRMRFQIEGLDNVKLSDNARFCLESINVPI